MMSAMMAAWRLLNPDAVIPGWHQTRNLEIPGSMLRIAPE
jgi:hypothetical protein